MADASGNQAYRVGVDIGGTFTDVVLATADGRVAIEKLLSTPADYSVAVVDDLQVLQLVVTGQIAEGEVRGFARVERERAIRLIGRT